MSRADPIVFNGSPEIIGDVVDYVNKRKLVKLVNNVPYFNCILEKLLDWSFSKMPAYPRLAFY